MALDYYKIFVEMGERHIELTKQQKTVEVELAKLTETIQHIFKMLTPAQQRKAQKVIERIEGPKGELGFYLISDGGPNPYRYRIRPPSLINLTVLEDMCLGSNVADVVLIFGSVDIVLGEVDR